MTEIFNLEAIPLNWKSVRLGDVVDFQGGSQPPKSIFTTTASLDHIRLVQIRDFKTDKFKTYIPKSQAKRFFDADDIMIGRYGPPIFQILRGLSGSYNVALMKAVPKESLDKNYLFRLLQAPRLQKYVVENSQRTAGQTGVNLDLLERLVVPLPPLPEQQRIATILDKADAIRRKRQAALQPTEELLRSEFLEMFGDPVTNPRGWPSKKLEELAEVAGGAMKGRKFNGHQTVALPYLRVANVQDGFLNLKEVKEIEVLATDVEKYRLQVGDLLMTEGGDPDKLGRGTVWQGEIDLCLHQNHIFRVRANRQLVHPEFLSALTGSARGKRYFLRAAKQTTGIATINMTQLRGFPVLLPPIDLQQEYARVVAQMRLLKTKLEQTAICQDHFFYSLVQRAFRGEL